MSACKIWHVFVERLHSEHSDITYILQNVRTRSAEALRDVQDDQLYCIAKGDVEQSPPGVSQFLGYCLGGVREQASQGNNGDGIHSKDNLGIQFGKAGGNANGHEDKQQIEPATGKAVLRMHSKAYGAIFESGRNTGLLDWPILIYGGRFLSLSFGILRGRGGGRRSCGCNVGNIGVEAVVRSFCGCDDVAVTGLTCSGTGSTRHLGAVALCILRLSLLS